MSMRQTHYHGRLIFDVYQIYLSILEIKARRGTANGKITPHWQAFLLNRHFPVVAAGNNTDYHDGLVYRLDGLRLGMNMY